MRVYNSDLLKIGNVNTPASIQLGLEASVPQLLLHSENMGLNCVNDVLRLGKFTNWNTIRTGATVCWDTINLSVAEGGVKIFMQPTVSGTINNMATSSYGDLVPVTPPLKLENFNRLESYGRKLIIGSKNNELESVYARRYYSSTSTGIESVSDNRYKTNVRDIESVLDKMVKISPVRFDYVKMDSVQEKVVDPERSNRVGFIAQELIKIFPEAVNYHEDDDIYTVDYSVLIPFLVKALQEQQLEIEELKKSIH